MLFRGGVAADHVRWSPPASLTLDAGRGSPVVAPWGRRGAVTGDAWLALGWMGQVNGLPGADSLWSASEQYALPLPPYPFCLLLLFI